MTGEAWLREFIAKPREWCPQCRRWNEVEPPPWWRGNCYHFRDHERSNSAKKP